MEPKQTELFSSTEEEKKLDGQDRAVESRRKVFDIACKTALFLARHSPSREVSIDDVQWSLARQGHDPSSLGNAAGKVFSGKEWKATGRTKKSRRKGNHSRRILVWRLEK